MIVKMIRVLMTPHLSKFGNEESGIKRVVEAYFRYLPDFGIQLVKPEQSFDLHAVHAGMTGGECDIAHLHGLYWTSDYDAAGWEYSANAKIVDALRHAKEVTVPSEWVAETVQRDMRFSPHVIPHGIDVNEWQPRKHQGYVLWNKNRRADVCDPSPMMKLAELHYGIQFITTFIPYQYTRILSNVRVTGRIPHAKMKEYISHAAVYLSTTKETFCIGDLEAMSAGVPILGFAWGGNLGLVQHGVNGYLAQPDDIEDLATGLDYCIKHRDTLGANGRELAKKWDWPSAVEKVAEVYKLAVRGNPNEGKVSVVIPCYNYAHTLERAVSSVLNQTYPAKEIIIVNDGSTDKTEETAKALCEKHKRIRLVSKPNGGVATARNTGVEQCTSEYICCLDADDEIAPQFLEACVTELRKDRSLGIAYTGLFFKKADGSEGLSQWPGDCNYDAQMSYRNVDNPRGVNQIPTCNVFRREAWVRAGGYKQRYAPLGAGAEDAELWTRIMSIGYGAKKATTAGLFIYHDQGRVSKAFSDGSIDRSLLEPPWLELHPWAKDHKHPFASRATPKRDRDGRILLSHPVRQYDQPVVSIIIPVGKGHEEIMRGALDSVESQTYRRWEAIVVFDNGIIEERAKELLVSYPYVRVGFTPPEEKGAGKARNVGAEMARAPFLVFLDADDAISPDFLDKTLAVWHRVKSEGGGDDGTRIIVYTDYMRRTITTQEDLQKNFGQQDILQYNEKTMEALIGGRSADYDCERAQRQPEFVQRTDPFHWCLVTCLVPKIWHERIGGFDNMESFEDVLYHWKMARHGVCYVRLPEQLVMYRMYTGTRRERASIHTDEGRKVAKNMLEYAKIELEKIEMAKCSKCPDGSKTPPPPAAVTYSEGKTAADTEARRLEDDNYVLCEYLSTNIGNHHIYGRGNVHGQGRQEYYGYKAGGCTILVHRKDIEAQPHLFRPIHSEQGLPVAEVRVPDAPTPLRQQKQPEPVQLSTEGEIPEYIAPKVGEVVEKVDEPQKIEPTPEISTPEASQEEVQTEMALEDDPFNAFTSAEEQFDINLVPGVTPEIADQLRELKRDTKEGILAMGVDGLQKVRGIGKVKAEAIIAWLSQ
jgi:glycosyltransferase involved in cell wall biosynthesis